MSSTIQSRPAARQALEEFVENQVNLRFKLLRFMQRAIKAKLLPSFNEVLGCHAWPIPAFTKAWDFFHEEKVTIPTGAPGHVQIRHFESEGVPIAGSVGYNGIRRCRNMFYCPVCSLQRHFKISSEVAQVVDAILRNKWHLNMITLTARHDVETKCVDFSKAFQEAVRVLRRSKPWEALKKGLIGTISTIECTDDNPDVVYRQKSGFHWHQHVLVISERVIDDDLGERIKKSWVKACESKGLSAMVEHGCDIRVAGNDRKSMEMLGEYTSKIGSIVLEMTSPHTKDGRLKRRITMTTELALLATGKYPFLYSRYSDYMYAVKGCTFVRFSQGLREKCGVGEVKESLGEAVVDYDFAYDYYSRVDEFEHVARHAYQNQLLALVRESLLKKGSALNDIQEAVELLSQDVDPILRKPFEEDPPLIVE